MQERSVIGSTTAAMFMPLLEFYQRLSPFILLAIVLIIVDSRFGIAAARKRGEEIRTSRKWRRAINKLVDYVCWVTLSGLFGTAFGDALGIPVLTILMLIIIYGVEVSSCYNNYFEAKGINKKVNILKLFKRSELFDAVEDKNDKQDE